MRAQNDTELAKQSGKFSLSVPQGLKNDCGYQCKKLSEPVQLSGQQPYTQQQI